MTEAYRGLPPEPIRTTDALVEALRDHPPKIFRGATKPLQDLRGEEGSRVTSVHFSLDEMNKRFGSLVGRASAWPFSRVSEDFFGSLYEVTRRDLVRYSYSRKPLFLSRSFVYNAGNVPADGIFHPYQTLGFYSADPEALQSVGIEVTEFQKREGDSVEMVNVYFVMKGAPFLEGETVDGESSFDVQGRRFASSQIFVGTPYATEEEAYRHGEIFGIVSPAK